jgi:predicted TIM-barrel fold metal-dependent hydrolase
MPPVRRTWLVVASISAAATALSLLVPWAAGRVRPGADRPPALPSPLPLARIDAHLHVEAAAVDQAVRLAAGFDTGAILNVSGGWFGDGLENQLAAAARHPGRVRVLMNLDLRGCCGEAWRTREAARVAMGRASGAAGLDIGGDALAAAPLDGPDLAPVLDACQKARIPVSVHLGGAGERAALARVAADRPALQLLAAHLGGPGAGPDELSRLLDRLPNLHLDISARLADLSAAPGEARALFLSHPGRLLYGTNVWVEGRSPDQVRVLGAGRTEAEVRAYFLGHLRFLETRDPDIPLPGAGLVRGLGLPLPVLEQVYHRNAERLLGFPEPP